MEILQLILTGLKVQGGLLVVEKQVVMEHKQQVLDFIKI
jgi:hypothetical protein